jgi:ParB/RepB/Spo0J family partition protein
MTNALTTLPAPTVPEPAEKRIVVDEVVFEDGSRFGNYNLVHIRISRTNRKRFNQAKLSELAASILSKGLAQPILIRPVTPTADEPQSFEIVAGERRFRACIIAGLSVIPAFCRNLSDQEALELQILENLQRDNPHPLEEAEGYERLMMKHGYTADQLVDKLNKSRSYVYGRLKLCALNLEVRELFLDNEEHLQASTALLIARIPLAKLQTKALNEILRPNGRVDDEPMSYRKAKEWLQQNYMLDLRKAIFLTDDAKLVKTAGNCNKCPKRAGNQPEVFEGVDANVCTDPECFKEKTAAHYDKLHADALKQKIPVHEGQEAYNTWSEIYRAGSDLVCDETPLYTFERVAPHTGLSGTLATRLKREQLPQVAAYTRSEKGIMQPLYVRAVAQSSLEQAGACETAEVREARTQSEQKELVKESPKKKAKEAAQHAAEASKQERAEEITSKRVALYRKVRSSTQTGFSLEMIREVAKLLVREKPLPDDLLDDLYTFEDRSDDGICAYIDQAEFPQIELLMLDLMMGEHLSVEHWEVDRADDSYGVDALNAMAKLERIDPGQDHRQAAQAPAEPALAQSADAAPPAAKVARPKLQLKAKPVDIEPVPVADAGPVIKVKKHRTVELKPASAWPFPTQSN